VRAAGPVADRLRPVAERLPRTVDLARSLTDSLDKQDVAALIGRHMYFSSAASSRFDRFSHILPSYQVTGTCAVWADVEPLRNCDAHFGGYKGDRGVPVPEVDPKRKAVATRGGARAADEQALDFLLGP
jgi:hypothetical protein